jgi:hypothetical protein
MSAYEIPGFSFSLPANADYSVEATSGQFRFVDVNSSSKAVTAGLAADAIGVRQNNPRANEATTIVSTGIVFVEAGEAIAAGDYIKSMANGLAGEADTAGDYILGRALTGAASGEFCTVLLAGPTGHARFA